jgi:hypothetical protein
MPQAGLPVDRLGNPLQNVSAGILCAGCRGPFTPARRNQRHCRPSCRGLALVERRRARVSDEPEDRDGVTRGLFE